MRKGTRVSVEPADHLPKFGRKEDIAQGQFISYLLSLYNTFCQLSQLLSCLGRRGNILFQILDNIL